MKFEFTIPGKPCGKQRPRFGGGRTYTPAKTVNYENLVRMCFKQAYPDSLPIPPKTEISAYITAYFPIPQSVSRKRRELMKQTFICPTVKPDTDNIAKIVLDALNGLAYHDDAQIVNLTLCKVYGDVPRVAVELSTEEIL